MGHFKWQYNPRPHWTSISTHAIQISKLAQRHNCVKNLRQELLQSQHYSLSRQPRLLKLFDEFYLTSSDQIAPLFKSGVLYNFFEGNIACGRRPAYKPRVWDRWFKSCCCHICEVWTSLHPYSPWFQNSQNQRHCHCWLLCTTICFQLKRSVHKPYNFKIFKLRKTRFSDWDAFWSVLDFR